MPATNPTPPMVATIHRSTLNLLENPAHIEDRLRNKSYGYRWHRNRSRKISRRSAPNRQHGKPLWLYTPVPEPRSSLPALERPRLLDTRFSLQPVWSSGARIRRHHCEILCGPLCHHLYDVLEDQSERPRHAPPLPPAEKGPPGSFRYQQNSMELQQVPGSSRRHCIGTLRLKSQTRRPRARYREGLGTHQPLSPQRPFRIVTTNFGLFSVP